MKERETEKVGDNDESADLKGRKNKTLAAKKKKKRRRRLCLFFVSARLMDSDSALLLLSMAMMVHENVSNR